LLVLSVSPLSGRQAEFSRSLPCKFFQSVRRGLFGGVRNVE
jgi:hypothetical protein